MLTTGQNPTYFDMGADPTGTRLLGVFVADPSDGSGQTGTISICSAPAGIGFSWANAYTAMLYSGALPLVPLRVQNQGFSGALGFEGAARLVLVANAATDAAGVLTEYTSADGGRTFTVLPAPSS